MYINIKQKVIIKFKIKAELFRLYKTRLTLIRHDTTRQNIRAKNALSVLLLESIYLKIVCTNDIFKLIYKLHL